MKLIQLVDNKQYIEQNCWQHQLARGLRGYCDAEMVELGSADASIRSASLVLSTLKLRTLNREMPRLKELLSSTPIAIYDQDPWEGFIDSGTCKGTYQAAATNLNVRSFLNTSKHWTDYINSLGFRSQFVKMWPLREYCATGTPWANRRTDVGFMGTLHPYRKRFFERLLALGISVHVEPSRDYASFLSFLSETKFFIHNEDDNTWSINGSPIVKNCCWCKEIEIAARGCSPVREWEPECENYHVSQIPSILTYKSLDDLPNLIQNKLSDSSASSREAEASVGFIRSQPAWYDLYESLVVL